MPRPRHPPAPLLLPPATPRELLLHIIAHHYRHHRHPTTLILANYSSRADFVASLVEELLQLEESSSSSSSSSSPPSPSLLANTIHQAAAARHVRVLATPTVTHLRALLSTFPTPEGEYSTIRPPPPPSDAYASAAPLGASCPECRIPTTQPLLVVYGLVDAHRGTSEWSSQGVGGTAAAVVDACADVGGLRAVLVEPKQRRRRRRVPAVQQDQQDDGGSVDGNRDQDHVKEEGVENERLDNGDDDTELDNIPTLANWLDEGIPLLGGFHEDQDDKMVAIGSVLGRWFRLVPPPLLEPPPEQTATDPIPPAA